MSKHIATRRESTLRFHKRQLLRVLVHLQQNLDEPLTLEAVAELACLSPFHFHRVFRGMLGESVMAHVRRLRLERAAMTLRRSRSPVIEIALAAGYESHEAFSRSFRSAFHLSPSAFRSRPTCPTRLHAPSGIHFCPDALPQDFRSINQGIHTMQVHIETIAPIRVAYVRHQGPYAECSVAWDKLCGWLGMEGYLSPGRRFIGISYDDPDETPPEKIRYDACVEIEDDFEATSEIGVQTIAGGDYARVTHQGPYETLSDSYRRVLGQWLPRQSRRLRNAPGFEVYFNTPESTAPEDLVTDIYFPLA